MKRINNLILALAGLFAVACADTFEERYDLAVNTDRYSVTAEAGKLPVTVYSSGAWTAQLTAESAWATLDRTAGSGITTIRLNYADNPKAMLNREDNDQRYLQVKSLTAAEYAALGSYSPTTLYRITDADPAVVYLGDLKLSVAAD